MLYFAIAILQIVQSVAKVFEIKWSYEENVIKLTILTAIMNCVWIFSTAIGVSAVMNGDWFMMIVYVCSGVAGKLLAFKFFNKVNYRTLFLRKMSKNKFNEN